MKLFFKILTALLAVLPVAVVVVFLVEGGRVSTIETPSMATYAPVGTLVVTEPVQINHLHVGQVILFTPPGDTRTYFHRIAKITPAGISTRGDLNAAADPWLLQAGNVHGVELFHVPALGWFVKYLPILGVGTFGLVIYLMFFGRRGRRLPVVVLGGSVLVMVANIVVSPFERAVLLSQNVTEHGVRMVRFVVTGVLPLHATTSLSNVTANPGEVATVLFPAKGSHMLSLRPDLSSPLLVGALVLLNMLPIMIAFVGWTVEKRQTTRTALNVSEVTADVPPTPAEVLIDGVPLHVFGEEILLDIDSVYRQRVRTLDNVYAQRVSV